MIRMRRSTGEWCMGYLEFKQMDFRKLCLFLKINPDERVKGQHVH